MQHEINEVEITLVCDNATVKKCTSLYAYMISKTSSHGEEDEELLLKKKRQKHALHTLHVNPKPTLMDIIKQLLLEIGFIEEMRTT